MILCCVFREILAKTLNIIQFETILKQNNSKVFEIFGKNFEIFGIFRKNFGDQKLHFSKIFENSFLKNQ